MKENIEVGDNVLVIWGDFSDEGKVTKIMDEAIVVGIFTNDNFKTYQVQDIKGRRFNVSEYRLQKQSFIKIFDIEL